MPHKDPEIRKEYQKKYREASKEKRVAYAHAYYLKNMEKLLIKQRERAKGRNRRYVESLKLHKIGDVPTTEEMEEILRQRIEHNKQQSRDHRYQLKLQVIDHYTSGQRKCECCGETIIEFLTLDHPNNDGAKHRKELGGKVVNGWKYYEWLIRNNFPVEHVVMCYNCNCGRRLGVCPHKRIATPLLISK
jgi:hypothetical protein